MTFIGPAAQQPAGTNLFGQAEWARRGDDDARIAANAIPVGVINAYWGATAPAGWLVCDGSTFSATTWPALAVLLGGTTLPDLRGRFILGKAAAGTGSTLGGTGGSADAVAVTHNHTQDVHGHTVNNHNHGGGTGVHAHTVTAGLGGGNIGLTAGGSNYNLLEQSKSTSSDGQGNTTESPGTTTTAATNQAAGASGTDANLPPWLALAMIIKAG